jgi:hypothetical protein
MGDLMFKRLYRFVNACWAEIVSGLGLNLSIMAVRNHYDFAHDCLKDSICIFGITGIVISSVACLLLSARLFSRMLDNKMHEYYDDLECINCNRLTSKLADARHETEKLKDTVINLTAKID